MFIKLRVSSKSKKWIFLLNLFLGLVPTKKIPGLYFYDWFLSEKYWQKLVLRLVSSRKQSENLILQF